MNHCCMILLLRRSISNSFSIISLSTVSAKLYQTKNYFFSVLLYNAIWGSLGALNVRLAFFVDGGMVGACVGVLLLHQK